MNVLLVTSITLALVHTLIGVDHYLPFIVLGQANNWSIKKTMFIVLMCGIGHVTVSVALGFAGIALSSGAEILIGIENLRGIISTYFLIAFGFVYTLYGIRQVMKNKTHSHITVDGQTLMHAHLKNGEGHEHGGHHPDSKRSKNVFWGLFILLVLGPCEPLIPIIMYPAAMHNTFMLVSVTLSFAFFTIATMLLMTFLGLKGVRMFKFNKLEKYSHVLAGSSVLACGILVLALPI